MRAFLNTPNPNCSCGFHIEIESHISPPCKT